MFSAQLENETFEDLCGMHLEDTFKRKGKMEIKNDFLSKGIFKRRPFIHFSP